MTITTTTTTMATASTLRDIYRQLEHPYQADFTNYVFMVQPPKYSFTSKSTSKWPQFVLSGGGLAAVRQDQHGEHQGWKGRYVNSFSWRASKRWNHKQIMLLFGRSSQNIVCCWGSFKGRILYFRVYTVFDVDFVCNSSLLLLIFSNIWSGSSHDQQSFKRQIYEQTLVKLPYIVAWTPYGGSISEETRHKFFPMMW